MCRDIIFALVCFPKRWLQIEGKEKQTLNFAAQNVYTVIAFVQKMKSMQSAKPSFPFPSAPSVCINEVLLPMDFKWQQVRVVYKFIKRLKCLNFTICFSVRFFFILTQTESQRDMKLMHLHSQPIIKILFEHISNKLRKE